MAAKTSIAEELLELISERQQISFNELSDTYFSRGTAKSNLEGALRDLEGRGLVASRNNGGILTYYVLEKDPLKRVLIVEDDKNINKLMALSIGTDFDIDQIYDGKDAITAVRQDRPDLVILDLMLPHRDGLDICQTIKSDPTIKNTVVIIVSAMEPTSSRFKGIKYGADYYIKKPFDPRELRSLVSIFLRKKGKRFDPLIDLPDEERLSNEFERSIKEGSAYTIGRLKIENLALYTTKFGGSSGMVILRLVSQLLQDSIKKQKQETFVGFLNSDEFVIAGNKQKVNDTVTEVTRELEDVIPFIMQDLGFRPSEISLESLFESDEVPRLSMTFTESEKKDRLTRREEVLRKRGAKTDDIGSYTYEELQKMLGSGSLNVVISRDDKGVRLQVGKGPSQE